MSPTTTQRLGRLALLTSAVLGITACGGGGGDESAPSVTPPPPVPTSVAGTVLVTPPAPTEVFAPAPSPPPPPTPTPPPPPPGAPPPPPPPAPAPAPALLVTICFDSNANGGCDTGEPSTVAAADGSYSLTGLPASQQPGAQLLAVVSVSGGTPYTLRTSVVRPAVISPTTTLLEAGISHGLSRAEAEAASARQLQVGAALLYRNYLATPGTPSEDSAMRLNDWAIITNLRDGVPLVVGGGSASSGDRRAPTRFATCCWRSTRRSFAPSSPRI